MNLSLGDEVTIKATVIGLSERDPVWVKIETPSKQVLYTNQNDIATHTPKPRPLVPGDKVKKSAIYPNDAGEIIAIDECYAWVRWSGGGRSVHALGNLERITK